MAKRSVIETMATTLTTRRLATAANPVLLMVSGGSDSTALAYAAKVLNAKGRLGPLAMLHVNHHIRGAAADGDAAFVSLLAQALDIPLFMCDVDIPALTAHGENLEAVARSERYTAARDALESLCAHTGTPVSDGRIATAHTQDDRVENFYMRSIVGTGPGGFRSMAYQTGQVIRPLLDVNRDDLRDFLKQVDAAQAAIHDEAGNLWREDVTNACTDRFRAYVRHEIVPRAKERNAQLTDTLCRSMNLIADEDDFLNRMAEDALTASRQWLSKHHDCASCPKADTCRRQNRLIDGFDPTRGALLLPAFCEQPPVIQRRMLKKTLQDILGPDARVETASIQAILDGIDTASEPAASGSSNATELGNANAAPSSLAAPSSSAAPAPHAAPKPRSGYTTNIQGNLAVSANKQGIRIEPMEDYRARRKRA